MHTHGRQGYYSLNLQFIDKMEQHILLRSFAACKAFKGIHACSRRSGQCGNFRRKKCFSLQLHCPSRRILVVVMNLHMKLFNKKNTS